MTHSTLRRLLVCALPFALSACGFTDWANANMPVIGQRCENWQCFTGSGQQQSEINQQERLQREAGQANGSPPPPPPGSAPGAPPVSAPPVQPLAPSVPEAPTYHYVPRAPAAPGTSPVDGQYQPME